MTFLVPGVPGDQRQEGRMSEPQWNGDRVSDEDGEAVWLAVDAYPTEADALKEARPDGDDGFAEVHGTVRFRLRDLDLDDIDDLYMHEEWGVTTTVEPDENGREFWVVVLHPESSYLAASKPI